MLSGDDGSEFKSLKSRLPLIKCHCGREILLLPDIRAMSRAIENHAAEHVSKEISESEREDLEEDIVDELISQVFELASFRCG